ncbi:MAG: hypothetical protein GX547_10730 [Phycisphaerae bacterium]|nr:hypothetical protein [Phycisphaerae bacterium]
MKLQSPRRQHPAPEDTIAAEDLGFLTDLFGQAGLELRGYRLSPLQRRISACCRALQVASVTEARALLSRAPHMVPRALDAVVLGVSEFFRDPAVFEELRARVLPELAAGRRPLRVMSIGCADGRELYSVAILLADNNLLDDCSLLGIDCRPEAIAQAQAGLFGLAALDRVPDELRERYFVGRGLLFEISSAIRGRTTWSVGDLFKLPPPPACDLILFRNVSIYLEPNAAAEAWRCILPLVRPGGAVVLGKAERPPKSSGLTKIGSGIYGRLSGDSN